MSRKVRNRMQRHQSQVRVAARKTWAPEIAGLLLVIVAVLNSAGAFA